MIVLGRLSQYERPITVSQTVVRSDDRFQLQRPTTAVQRRCVQLCPYLYGNSGCFRLGRLPGKALTHWEAPPLHSARQERTLG